VGVGVCRNFSPAGNGAGAATGEITFFAGVGLWLGFGDEGEPNAPGVGVPVGLGPLVAFGEADGAAKGETDADPVWAGARAATKMMTHNQLIARAPARRNLGDGSTLVARERRGIKRLLLFLPRNQHGTMVPMRSPGSYTAQKLEHCIIDLMIGVTAVSIGSNSLWIGVGPASVW
jgi:hypothetical protein